MMPLTSVPIAGAETLVDLVSATVAVQLTMFTGKDIALGGVLPDELAPSVIAVPSTTIFSFDASTSPPAVKVSPLMLCPLSIVLMLAPENAVTAAPWVCAVPSVNVGLLAVALSVGALLTGVTATFEARERLVVSAPPLAVPPLSWIEVSVIVRVPAVGS